MKRKKLLLILPVVLLSVTSCGQTKIEWKNHLEEYIFTMDYKNDFKILQLTDIHWSISTDEPGSRQYLTKVMNEVEKKYGKVDLIEITGDTFMLANHQTVTDFYQFISNFDIPYASTWGNHDRQGTYNPSWLYEQTEKAKNSKFKNINDDLHGDSNYVINLKKDGETKWQIANLDSGAGYLDSALSLKGTYDWIQDDQVEWWKAEHDLVGKDVPTIAYYHIAQKDVYDGYEEALKLSKGQPSEVTKYNYYKLEGFGGSTHCTRNFFDVGKENGLKGIFMGHAHSMDFTMDYQGVTLGFGVKSGKELYYGKPTDEDIKAVGQTEKFDLIGASVVVLHDDGKFDLNHLYLNERENGDFVEWMEY